MSATEENKTANEEKKTESASWELLKYSIASVAAGFSIGTAGLVFSVLKDKEPCGFFIGAFCFSFGLYYVLLKELKLYTGRIGFLSESIPRFALMLILNFVGAALAGYLAKASYKVDPIVGIAETKLGLCWLNVLGRAFLCGMMMYFAVDGWKRTRSPFPVCLGVFIFVACGFEHCVADIFYFTAADKLLALETWKFTFFAVLGNSLGAVALRKISLC